MKVESGLTKRVATAREVAAIIGEGLRTFKERIKADPTFPRPIQLSPKQPVWRIVDVDRWLAEQPGVETRPEPASLRRARLERTGKSEVESATA